MDKPEKPSDEYRRKIEKTIEGLAKVLALGDQKTPEDFIKYPKIRRFVEYGKKPSFQDEVSVDSMRYFLKQKIDNDRDRQDSYDWIYSHLNKESVIQSMGYARYFILKKLDNQALPVLLESASKHIIDNFIQGIHSLTGRGTGVFFSQVSKQNFTYQRNNMLQAIFEYDQESLLAEKAKNSISYDPRIIKEECLTYRSEVTGEKASHIKKIFHIFIECLKFNDFLNKKIYNSLQKSTEQDRLDKEPGFEQYQNLLFEKSQSIRLKFGDLNNPVKKYFSRNRSQQGGLGSFFSRNVSSSSNYRVEMISGLVKSMTSLLRGKNFGSVLENLEVFEEFERDLLELSSDAALGGVKILEGRAQAQGRQLEVEGFRCLEDLITINFKYVKALHFTIHYLAHKESIRVQKYFVEKIESTPKREKRKEREEPSGPRTVNPVGTGASPSAAKQARTKGPIRDLSKLFGKLTTHESPGDGVPRDRRRNFKE